MRKANDLLVMIELLIKEYNVEETNVELRYGELPRTRPAWPPTAAPWRKDAKATSGT